MKAKRKILKSHTCVKKHKVGNDTGLEKVEESKAKCKITQVAVDIKRRSEHGENGPPVCCHPH